MKYQPFSTDIGLTECALCEQSRELRESHIIPKFVIDWFKRSSATGYIRFGFDPNRRRQDGWKPKLLCQECEQMMAKWEKYVAEHIFRPLHSSNSAPIHYDESLAKFAVSISWRVLTAHDKQGLLVNYPEALVRTIRIALSQWRDFILGSRPHPGRFEQHMLGLSAIESTTMRDLPKNMNRYILRSIDCDIAYKGSSAFVYTKMGRLILLGLLEMPREWKWKGTKVHMRSGEFGANDIIIPSSIGQYLIQSAEKSNLYPELSDHQRKVIGDSLMKNPKRVATSESFQAFQHDVRLFGDSVFDS